jgi:hypothetical protein
MSYRFMVDILVTTKRQWQRNHLEARGADFTHWSKSNLWHGPPKAEAFSTLVLQLLIFTYFQVFFNQ